MLIYRIIKTGLPWFALKPIGELLEKDWIKVPLYIKHAKLLNLKKNLSSATLVTEANSCAEFLNSMKEPLKLGGYTVKAQMVKW